MGNRERNNFVCTAITNTAIELLAKKDIKEISISELCSQAGVSRNSFYRNYDSITDIFQSRTRDLLSEWDTSYRASGKNSNSELYGSLFGHLKGNSDFYLLLYERGILKLVLNVILEMTGPKPEMDNAWAYPTAFITYGLYGWITEWIARGMQESAEEMTALLASHQIK